MRHAVLLLVCLAITTDAIAGWPMHVIDNTSRGPDGVRLADANGDGLPDIATGFEQGGVTRVYLHPGHVEVREPSPMVTTGKTRDAEDAVLVDLDGDGAMDVVSCCEGKTKSVFVSWAPADKTKFLDASAWKCEAVPAVTRAAGPSSGHALPSVMWMFCLPMQIDGKRGIDLVIGSKAGGKQGSLAAPFGWLESPTSPRDLGAWIWHPIIDVGWTMGIESADMDGDGDTDLILTDRYGNHTGCRWLENPCSADESSVSSAASSRKANVSSASSGVTAAGYSGGWKKHDIGAIGENCMFFALADLDADGLQDVAVVTSANKLHAIRRLNREGTQWQDSDVPLPSDIIGRGKGIAAGDIDLDGRMDLVVSFEQSTSPRHSLIWLSPDGSPLTGKWTWHELSGIKGVKNDQVRLADLDGDGDLDALTTEEVTNLGVIWYENPAKQPK